MAKKEIAPSDRVIDAVIPRLTDRVHQVMAQQGVPGVALGIVRDQQLAWAGGFGFADLATQRPMDSTTMFGVASITKTFTATAIMQLRDRGRLSLDDRLDRFVPEIKKVRAASHDRINSVPTSIRDITIRRLMTHRTGLMGEAPGEIWTTLNFPSTKEILASLSQVEMVIEPDSVFKYNNLAFVLLGEVVARVSRRNFREYVRRQILEPLEMTASGFEVPNPHNATGYMPERYQDVPAVASDPSTNGYLAAAGLRSCVTDLAKWISFQLRAEGDQVLKRKSLSEMHRVTFVEPDWLVGYGLTWWALRVGENIYVGHGGSVPGFLSMVAFSKPHRIGVVVLTNKQGNIASGTIVLEALEMLTGEAKKVVRAPAPTPVPENLRPLLGRYVGAPAFGALFHVEWRDGGLRLATPMDPFMMPLPPAPLKPTGKPNEFVSEVGRWAGEPVKFEFDESGRVTGMKTVALGVMKKID